MEPISHSRALAFQLLKFFSRWKVQRICWIFYVQQLYCNKWKSSLKLNGEDIPIEYVASRQCSANFLMQLLFWFTIVLKDILLITFHLCFVTRKISSNSIKGLFNMYLLPWCIILYNETVWPTLTTSITCDVESIHITPCLG